jgi:ABC-2 type transport system permease protein
VTLGVALLLPVVLLFIFGYALRLDVEEAPLAVVDLDGTPASRELAARFDRARELQVVARLAEAGGLAPLLAEGRVRVALVIPAGFGRDLARGTPVEVQVLVDGSFAATARLIAAYAEGIAASFDVAGGVGAGAHPLPVRVEPRVWYNPNLESSVSVVPGLFGVILMAFPPLLTALAVVREKERGTMKQILVSPLPPWVFVVGKLAPYAVLAFADLVLVLGAGVLVFDIPLLGSPALLLGASVLYVVATLGIGLFVSTVCRTQVAALLLVLVLTVMPSFMFSGFLYPIFTMPRPLQAYTQIFSGRYFVELSRGIFLKGVGAEVLWPQVASLALYAAVMVAMAVWRLRIRAE